VDARVRVRVVDVVLENGVKGERENKNGMDAMRENDVYSLYTIGDSSEGGRGET